MMSSFSSSSSLLTSFPLLSTPFPPQQSSLFTSSYIPIDYNLFQFIYESFLDWIPTQTDKLNILSRVSNIWITTDVIILEMLLSYFRDVFQIEHAFMYLPSLDLYDQILFQYVSTSRDQFAFWLQNYNNQFIFKVEEMVYFQILLEELIQIFEDSDNKINNEKKKPQKKRKLCDNDEDKKLSEPNKKNKAKMSSKPKKHQK